MKKKMFGICITRCSFGESIGFKQKKIIFFWMALV